jgi:hypothetical protein
MQSINDLRQLVKEQIEQVEQKALVEIHYDSEFNVSEVLDQVRSLCGIIIVKSEPSQKLTDRKMSVLTKIKFFSTTQQTKTYIAKLVDQALSIDGIYAFRIKKVKFSDTKA